MARVTMANLMAELAAQRQENEKLLREKANGASNAEYIRKDAEAAKAEIASIHAFLDAVPNPPASKFDSDAYGSRPIPAMTRLSVWLANRGRAA